MGQFLLLLITELTFALKMHVGERGKGGERETDLKAVGRTQINKHANISVAHTGDT